MPSSRFLLFSVCVLLAASHGMTRAQDAGPFSRGIPQTFGALALSCKQFQSNRDPAPATSDAMLMIRNGEIRVESAGNLVYRIPAASERQTLVSRNGARPGTDHLYHVDEAETGTGYFWFEVSYDAESAVGDTRRNELFVSESGQFVSYTHIAKLRSADPRVGVSEYTVRCEPA